MAYSRGAAAYKRGGELLPGFHRSPVLLDSPGVRTFH